MRIRALCLFALFWALAQVAAGAEPAREVHGMADAFAAPGVALAWGVLRGPDEAATTVALRIVADPATFASVAVAGSDPFTQRATLLLRATPTTDAVDVRVPRAHFADFPRSEIRLYGAAPASPSVTPKLVVFFLGVPDTTPEFASAAALEAYLAERVARVRGATEGKPP